MNPNRRWHHSVCLVSVLWFSSHAHPKILVISLSLLALTQLPDLRASIPLSCGRSVGFLFFSLLFFPLLRPLKCYFLIIALSLIAFFDSSSNSSSITVLDTQGSKCDKLTDWLTDCLADGCVTIYWTENGEPRCMLCVPDTDKGTHISMAYISLSRGHVIFSHWIHCKKGPRRAHIQNKFSYMSAQLQLSFSSSLFKLCITIWG